IEILARKEVRDGRGTGDVACRSWNITNHRLGAARQRRGVSARSAERHLISATHRGLPKPGDLIRKPHSGTEVIPVARNSALPGIGTTGPDVFVLSQEVWVAIGSGKVGLSHVLRAVRGRSRRNVSSVSTQINRIR